jgi:hypothetical protein
MTLAADHGILTQKVHCFFELTMIEAASTTWVPLYFQVTTPVILALAVSTPFFSPNGTILGVVSVNFDTNSMSKFLAKQQKGDIFILDTDAQIVATSVGNATVPSGSTLARVAGVNHTSAIVQETSKLIMNTFGTISKVPNATNLLYVDSSTKIFTKCLTF